MAPRKKKTETVNEDVEMSDRMTSPFYGKLPNQYETDDDWDYDEDDMDDDYEEEQKEFVRDYTMSGNDDFGVLGKRSPDGGISQVEFIYLKEVVPGPGLAEMIDHTNLKADATRDDIKKLCEEAAQYKFATVCVNGCWVRLCKELLDGTDVGVCTVVGFPLGASATATKLFEAENAIKDGASEIDVVMNIGAFKSGNFRLVMDELYRMSKLCESYQVTLKVILETCLLSKDEIVKACLIADAANVDFVKTSTGFSTGGATVEDVRLMRKTVREEIEVKASGGIRTRADAEKMIAAGASRIGASAGVKIVQEK